MLIKNIFSLKTFLCISLCCFSLLANSQNTTQKDTLEQYSFKELSNKFYEAKPDSLKAVLYAKYYIDKAIKEKDTLQMADGYYFLSDITKDSIHFVNYWNNIIKNTKNLNNKLYPAISYLELGNFYFYKGKKDIALNNYLQANIAEKKSNNDSLKCIITHRFGLIKSRNKKYKEAISLYKDAYKYYNNTNIDNNYYSLIINISTAYKKLQKYDSAYFYSKMIYKTAIKNRKKTVINFAINSLGNIEFKRGNFDKAISFLIMSMPSIIEDENYITLSTAYQNIAYSYYKINNKAKAIIYYQKIDSLFLSTKNYYESQKPAYKYLISHYKEKNNYKKQLEYINKYIRVDSVLNARSKSISKNLTENYDIPNLLAEKKRIENRLKGDLSTTKKWILAIGTLAFLLLLFLIHQTRKRKLYKQRFQELMSSPIKEIITKEKIIAKKEQSIPKETLENILTLLEQFETNHQYISHKITLSILAKTFETNSKYLSQVINQHKGKSFNNYVNQLRIKYTIEKLKTDSTFRKYSIKAIAYEVGFNTTESFSKAFYKNTGIKPSFFIKELEKK